MKKKEINYQLLIRRICLIVLDIICIIAASILALLTRFEFDFSQIPKEFLKVIYKYGPFTIVITLIIFSLFRIYSSLWEYAGIEEVFSLIAACLAAAVAKIVIILFTWSVMPRSWYVLDTIYLMILIGATRVSYRLIRLRRQNRTFPWSKRKKVMIIGGGEAGRSLITEIQNSKYLDQKVVCIIDDDPYKIGRYIKGVKVVGNRNSIKKSVKKYNVQQIILTIPSANAAKIRPIVEICQDTNCELMILPGVYQLVNGEVKASKLRPVNIDDLHRGTNMELMEDGTTIEQQMFAMATEKKVPLYGVLELLPLCNLNCDMCYVRMSREEMEEVGRLRTMEEWTKTAEDMMKAGTLFVLLTGGEPLLYPHFRELYQKLRELGMIITINTNGTLIDEAWADFFAENKPRRINITLYGASNETYERLCHYPGGFDKAVNGIRLLRERNIDVKVNGSLAKANVDDRMKIIELGESLDAPVRIDTYMYPSVRERNHAYNNQARLDPEMAAKARVEVLQREMGEEVFAQYRKIQLDEAENTPEGEAVPGQMACRAGKSSFVVNWQGEMRSCVVLDKPSIPLRDVEFEEAWKFTKKETESLRISARCSSCKLRKVCNTCVAAAIAETGKADGVPEYLCRYTEATVRYLKETSKK